MRNYLKVMVRLPSDILLKRDIIDFLILIVCYEWIESIRWYGLDASSSLIRVSWIIYEVFYFCFGFWFWILSVFELIFAYFLDFLGLVGSFTFLEMLSKKLNKSSSNPKSLAIFEYLLFLLSLLLIPNFFYNLSIS